MSKPSSGAKSVECEWVVAMKLNCAEFDSEEPTKEMIIDLIYWGEAQDFGR